MSLNSSRASRASAAVRPDVARVTPRAAGARRWLTGATLAVGLLALSGCGMDVQTNQPYTPAEGVNVDVSNSVDANAVVHVRNLGIISHGPGEGILSASMVSNGSDALTGVSGTAIKLDGSNGSSLSAQIPSPVEVGNGTLTVLTSVSPLITVQGADLGAGLDAVLNLQFRNAGQVTIRVPVLDGSEPQYRTITASPTPVSSPTPSE